MIDSHQIDLKIDEKIWSTSLVDAPFDWPVAIRIAIGLIDSLINLLNSKQSIPQTLLPAFINIDSEGSIQVDNASLDIGAPFAAPEILTGELPAERSLVYTTGAVLFHLLTGRPPIGDVWQLNVEFPEIPASLRDVLLRSLYYEPEKRFDNLYDLRKALIHVLVPSAWWEETIPRLPLATDTRSSLLDIAYSIRRQWLNLRDQLPWMRLGFAFKGLKSLFAKPWVRQLVAIVGILIYLQLLRTLFFG